MCSVLRKDLKFQISFRFKSIKICSKALVDTSTHKLSTHPRQSLPIILFKHYRQNHIQLNQKVDLTICSPLKAMGVHSRSTPPINIFINPSEGISKVSESLEYDMFWICISTELPWDHGLHCMNSYLIVCYFFLSVW